MQMQIVELGLATATAATATCGKLVKSFDLTALLTALQEMVGIVCNVFLLVYVGASGRGQILNCNIYLIFSKQYCLQVW